MPKCAGCGRVLDDPDALELARNAAGRWTLLCPRCRAGKPERRTDSKATPSDEAFGDAHFAAIAESLETTRRHNAEAAADAEDPLRKRAYERHEVEMPVHFAFVRDDVQYEAVALDLSEGGLRFRTEVPVRPDQVLAMTVQLPDVDDRPVRRMADIRRVRRTEEGVYECGARFIRRIGVEDTNRRTRRRQRWTAPVYLRRARSEWVERGDAADLSSAGIGLRTVEAFAADEVLALTLRVGPPAFEAGRLSARARVVRVDALGEARYAIGCAFLDTEFEPGPPVA